MGEQFEEQLGLKKRFKLQGLVAFVNLEERWRRKKMMKYTRKALNADGKS